MMQHLIIMHIAYLPEVQLQSARANNGFSFNLSVKPLNSGWYMNRYQGTEQKT
jgi:hypothetical protein